MIFIIIILILFILSPPTQAQELFPYQNNPVVFNQPSHNGARHPFVIKEQNQFSLWYADDMPTGFRILRAQSSNGIDWYDKRDTFVTNRQNASDPFVFVADNQYQLYFASSNYSRTSLWKSVSSDGITFIPGAEREILKPEQSWEQFSLSCPAVFQDQSTQYLFYAGAGQTAWAIGMATSADGETWQKCTNNPLISEGVSPQVVKYNDIFYLYFHSPRGLEVQQTNVLNGCDTIWTNRHVIDSEIRDPAPVVVDDDLWIYGTLALPSGSHIGLASSAKIQTPHYPIVIIPGMFASWNKEAILHNSVVSYDAWKLNPNITEYDAIMETLENNGRIVNEDLFVFPYDWRNPIEETTYNLDTFLISKIWKNNPSLPVQLVGHSLGGVVSRIYADQNPLKPIKQIVTVGSPLLGTVQAYKPLVAGEIDRENTLMWMAEKLILLLNKSGFESDKDTISQKLLVLFDILPAFSFLKSEGGTPITSAFTNNLLFQYPIDSAPPIPQQYIGA